jgi:hypothetical protein
MVFTQTGQCANRDQPNVNLVRFQHLHQIGRIVQQQLNLILDGTMLQSIYKWLGIQVTDRSNPDFPFHQY